MIQEQKDLQHKYAELVVQRATLTGYSNTEKLKATEQEIKEVHEPCRPHPATEFLLQVANGLNKKSKQLSRTLISNPNIAENLLKIAKERALLQRIFTITISELRCPSAGGCVRDHCV